MSNSWCTRQDENIYTHSSHCWRLDSNQRICNRTDACSRKTKLYIHFHTSRIYKFIVHTRTVCSVSHSHIRAHTFRLAYIERKFILFAVRTAILTVFSCLVTVSCVASSQIYPNSQGNNKIGRNRNPDKGVVHFFWFLKFEFEIVDRTSIEMKVVANLCCGCFLYENIQNSSFAPLLRIYLQSISIILVAFATRLLFVTNCCRKEKKIHVEKNISLMIIGYFSDFEN